MAVTTVEMTDRQYEIADAISEYVNTRPERDFNASQLARAAKCATHEAHFVLRWMIGADEIMPCGRGGAWTRYRGRRFGEIPSRALGS